MSEEMNFFIYLIELYAQHKGTRADKVLRRFDELGIADFICNDMYWGYHTERIENAFDDIDRLIAERAGMGIQRI